MIGLLLALALAASSDGGAALSPLGVQSRAHPDKVKLGEPFDYEIVVRHAASQRYELSLPRDLGAFEVSKVERQRDDAKDGTAVTTFRVKMALFELGPKDVPDFTLQISDQGQAGEVAVRGVSVEGVSTLPADADEKGEDLYGIQPPVDVPVRSWRLLWAALVALGVAGLAYAALRWWRNRPAPPAVVVPPEPLDVRIRAALDALRAEDLPGKGRFRELYFRLSEILRAYLGERYEFDALECTSAELLDAVRGLPTPGFPFEELRQFSDDSDLVKFAKSEPTVDLCKRDMDFAYLLLQKTWPPPAPAPAAPAPHAAGQLVS